MYYVEDSVENKLHIDDLCYLFYMPLLVDFINVVVNQFGLGTDSTFTMAVYICSLLILFWRNRKCIYKSDFGLIFFVVIFIIVNCEIFPQNRDYMLNTDMLIIYFFFLPVCIFSVRKIENWNGLIPSLRKFGIVAILTALVIMTFFDYEKYLVYMGFSYVLLPFIAALYVSFRTGGGFIDILLFLAGVVCVFIFGARAVILFLTLYIIIFEITRSDRNIQFKTVSTGILSTVALIVYANLNTIAEQLIKIPALQDSYFLSQLLKGALLESATRDSLYAACISRIQTMGLEVSGFFGDREYCSGGWPYPHNFIYEILMQWGWILGTLILIGMAVLLLKGVISKNSGKRDIAIFMIITGLARYIVSGSYLIEGKFWILLTVMIALIKSVNESFYDENERLEIVNVQRW